MLLSKIYTFIFQLFFGPSVKQFFQLINPKVCANAVRNPKSEGTRTDLVHKNPMYNAKPCWTHGNGKMDDSNKVGEALPDITDDDDGNAKSEISTIFIWITWWWRK